MEEMGIWIRPSKWFLVGRDEAPAGGGGKVNIDDMVFLVFLIASLVFLTVFLWAFAAQSLPRVLAVLAGGGIVMTGCASLLQQMLLP